jgi:enoyl-CoA hydratase/3-hydroxyacyl-CoA dehydrogenase
VLSGQSIAAQEALAIGLVDAVVPHEALDEEIRKFVMRGRPADRHPRPVPATHTAVAEFFHRGGVPAARDTTPDDPRVASALRRIDSKAPLALRVAAELIEKGEGLPIRQGLVLELERLEEIFSTADAYEGLSSVGRRPPVFKGA